MTFQIESFQKELKKFRTTQNPEDFIIEHPEWKRVANQFAAKLDVPSPKIIRVPTKFISACVSLDGDIFVSDGIMKMLDCNHLTAPSKPMQATLAHEMGHIKYDFKHIKDMEHSKYDFKHIKDMKHLPETILMHTLWFTVPVATMLAYALYEYATNTPHARQSTKKHDHDILDRVDKSIETTLKTERQNIDQNNGNPDYYNWLKRHLFDARYLMAGALGLGLGIAAHKYRGRATEFRADRVAVELMGEMDSFKVLAERLPKEASKVWKEMNTKPIDGTFIERLDRFIKTETYMLKGKLLSYHPTWKDRVEQAATHLERLKQTEKSCAATIV